MKLQGIRVLDLSLFLPGPHLSMMMADHGAEVIGLEPPGGEPVRNIGLTHKEASIWFRNVYRGKKSINLNLKHDQGREAFLKLCETVDVIIEAFRPGVVTRLGIDYEAVKKVNPAIVYCSISAYGQTGPKKHAPAHDLSIQADSGTVSINEGQDGAPAMPAMPVADMSASLMALSGILMAIIRQKETGFGDYLDISMQDAIVAWYPNVMGPPFAENRSPVPKEERSWGGAAMYNIYQTKDNRYLTLGGSELKFAKNLLMAFDRLDLFELCEQPPGKAQLPVKQFFQQKFLEKTLAQWQDFFSNVDVCWAPVRSLHEAINEQHLRERAMILEDPQGCKHLGVPIKFQEEPAKPDFQLPTFSEHTEQVLQTLGYSAEQIKTMKQDKAFMPKSKK